MMIKAESYKIFSEIYCPIVPAPLELYFGDRCRSVIMRRSHASTTDYSTHDLILWLFEQNKMFVVHIAQH